MILTFDAFHFRLIPVMSVRLPVKMCSWDQQFTYVVRKVSTSFINYISFTKCVVPFGFFSKEVITPMRSPRSEFIVTLAASRPEDAFIHVTANSILGVMMFSMAVKIAIWILSSTVSTMLPIFLSILSLKHLSTV